MNWLIYLYAAFHIICVIRALEELRDMLKYSEALEALPAATKWVTVGTMSAMLIITAPVLLIAGFALTVWHLVTGRI